jgi:hypothetical protein
MISQMRKTRKGSEDLSTRSRSSHRSKSSKSLINSVLTENNARLLLNLDLNLNRNRVRVSNVPVEHENEQCMTGTAAQQKCFDQEIDERTETQQTQPIQNNYVHMLQPTNPPNPLLCDPDRLHRLHRLRLQSPSSNCMEESLTRRLSWRGLDRRPSWRMSDKSRMLQMTQANIQKEELPSRNNGNFVLPENLAPRSSSTSLPQVAQASTEMNEQKLHVSSETVVTNM